jgi:drug/metabolite transporter (DMT)-like permease
MKVKSAAPLGASLIVLSSLFYASYGIWTTLMGDFFGGYTASALRSVVVLIILVPIALALRQLQPINFKQNWRYLAGMTVSGLFIWGPLYYSILHAGVGVSLAINFASIVLGMFVFGWLLLRERFTKDKFIACLLGLSGLFMIFAPSMSGIGWLALTAAVVSGLACSVNIIMAKQIKYNAAQSTIFLWVTSVLANFPVAFLLGEHMPALEWHAAWLFLIIFGVASVCSTWSQVKGLKLIEAGAAGILGLLEVVFAVIFGVVFFDEQPSLLVLLGMATIIAAAAVPYIKDYNAKRGTLDSTE